MFIDFSISNFRSIKEKQTISFEATEDKHLEDYYVVKKGKYRLLKIATILGANASGKSNIIFAFSLFPSFVLHPCENKSSKISYDKFALDVDYIEKDSEMVVNFLCGEQKYHYEVHFNNNIVSYELLQCYPFEELRPHKVFERTTDPVLGVSSLKWGYKYRSVSNTRTLTANLLHNRTVFGAFQNSNVDIPWMKDIVDWVATYIMQPVKTSEQRISEFVTKLISQQLIDRNLMTTQLKKADIGVSDFKVEKEVRELPKSMVDMLLADENTPLDVKTAIRVNPTTEEVRVRLIHNGSQGGVPFEFSQESGGTQRYYELTGVLLMLVKESHFVTIDELECRLHPDLYEHFIATYLSNAKDSQIVFTTHMREFLSNRDMFRDDSVWLSQKSDVGATEIYSMADFGSDVLRNTTSRYNVYRAGRLGAVPRLEDTYIDTTSSGK